MPAPSIVSFLTGANPLSDPLSLIFLQILIIVVFARILGLGLRYFKQPQVVAEVISGILLGKSALSSIPAFQTVVFPTASIPNLYLVANIGLTLYLFLIGLELDPKAIIKEVRKSAVISLTGIVFPFLLGTGASILLYKNLMPSGTTVPFPSFLIFTGVAMSITAFPVLARILTECELLVTKVGRLTISSAACDDVIAWCLLLVVVAIINNTGSYIIALYAFLTVVAWGLMLLFLVRPLLVRFVKASGDTVSQLGFFMIISLVFASGWFTESVGVHAIFGAFLVGLITPRENGFAVKIAEKIEDLVTIILLPLYFAYSGLNTRIDQLDNARSWAMIALVVATACIGKILGCSIASRLSGFSNRESLSIGILMNTKGLVELIVLNLGLAAGVINTSVFTVMVMMALITTCMTVPLISYVYPKSMYAPCAKPGQISTDVVAYTSLPPLDGVDKKKDLKILVPVLSVASVRPILSLMRKFGNIDAVELMALRLVDVDDRTSAIIKTHGASALENDRSLEMIQTVAQLNYITVDAIMHIVPSSAFVDHIVETAKENDVNVIVLARGHRLHDEDTQNTLSRNLENIVDAVYARSSSTVAVITDRGLVSSDSSGEGNNLLTVRSINSIRVTHQPGMHGNVYVPFLGTANDREALLFALRNYQGSRLIISVFNEGQRVSSDIAESTVVDVVGRTSSDAFKNLELLDHCRTLASTSDLLIQECDVVFGQANKEALEWVKSLRITGADLIVHGGSVKGYNTSLENYLNNECAASVMGVRLPGGLGF